VTRRFGQVDPLEVAFDEFETDIPENQTLASALEATRAVVRTPWLLRRVRRMHTVFHEAAPSSGDDPLLALDEMAYSRRNEHYRGAHELARLLLRRIAVKDLLSPGGTSCFAFLLDMNVLFEAFVARLVGDALEPLGVHVHSQRRDPSIILDEGTGKRYAAIIPDLLLETRGSSVPIRLPVDAKYKLYDQRAIDQADVYQTFFYAFAYAADEADGRPARAVILYPRDRDGSDVSLRVDTHVGRTSARIQAFGLDVEAALQIVKRGRPTIVNVPALGRLYRIHREVVDAASGEARWLAS
jgi:5-methylcytosine-specific restriction enzyme subunit McrC